MYCRQPAEQILASRVLVRYRMTNNLNSNLHGGGLYCMTTETLKGCKFKRPEVKYIFLYANNFISYKSTPVL
jgi:hypothetical protein